MSAADDLAARAHAGQVDKQGVDYIEHPRAVARAVTERARRVAVLHDVLEDTTYGLSMVRDEVPLTDAEASALLLVTRRVDESYRAFIERIASAAGEAGDIAREVKRADIDHNLGRLTPELAGLEKRYRRALNRLDGGEYR